MPSLLLVVEKESLKVMTWHLRRIFRFQSAVAAFILLPLPYLQAMPALLLLYQSCEKLRQTEVRILLFSISGISPVSDLQSLSLPQSKAHHGKAPLEGLALCSGQGLDQLETALDFFRCFLALLPGVLVLLLSLHVHSVCWALHRGCCIPPQWWVKWSSPNSLEYQEDYNSLTILEWKKLLLNSSHIS